MTDRIVKARDVAPLGPPGHCTWCFAPIGSEHEPTCAVPQRTVVVRVSVEMVISVPDSWTADQIEFHRNEGSWCCDNWRDELNGLMDRLESASLCSCGLISTAFVRDATADDEAANAWRAGDDLTAERKSPAPTE